MVISPLPGADGPSLLRALEYVLQSARNVRGGGGDWIHRYNSYMRWAIESQRQLGRKVTSRTLERLVLSRAYWALHGRLPGSALNAEIVDGELDLRISELEDAYQELQAQITRWSNVGCLAVPDTSFYIRSPGKIEDVDFRPLLGIRDEPVHLLVPIVVVDELDRLKESKESSVRWRAGYTLAVLDRILPDPREIGILHEEDYSPLNSGLIPCGKVTAEIVFDPTGHTRLPIADDELVDRSLAVQIVAGREVTMITYDTGQSTRARGAGIRSVRIKRDNSES